MYSRANVFFFNIFLHDSVSTNKLLNIKLRFFFYKINYRFKICRLKLTVDEKEELPCLLYLIQIFAPRPDWAETEPSIWKDSLVFVDSFAGAKAEAGDLIQSKCDVEDELGSFINKGGLNLLFTL